MFRLSKINILYSAFYILKDKRLEPAIKKLSPVINFMVDSGAYSNYVNSLKAMSSSGTKNPQVTLVDYMGLCHRLKNHVWKYVALDKVRDKEVSKSNYEKMIKDGLSPVPVAIVTSTSDELAQLDTSNGWLCVAGSASPAGGLGASDIIRRYHKIKAMFPKTHLHGLAFAKLPHIYTAPVTSADSISWCSGNLFGHVKRFNRLERGFTQTSGKQIFEKDLTDKNNITLLGYVTKTLGVTPEQLRHKRNYQTHYSFLGFSTAFAYLEFSQDLFTSSGKYYFFAGNKYQDLILLGALLETLYDDSGIIRADYTKFREIYMRLLRSPDEVLYNSLYEIYERCTEWKQQLP